MNMPLTVLDYEEVLEDKRRLTREIDQIINGNEAAKQASLCDLVGDIKLIVKALQFYIDFGKCPPHILRKLPKHFF